MVKDDTLNVIDWSGVKKMDLHEFTRLMMPEIRTRILAMLDDPHHVADGMVCFQNENGASPTWGNRYFITYGPGCTYKTVDPLLQRKYRGAGAISYYEKERKDKKLQRS